MGLRNSESTVGLRNSESTVGLRNSESLQWALGIVRVYSGP